MNYLSNFIKSIKEIVITIILQYLVIIISSYIYFAITKGDVEKFILNYGSIILVIIDILIIFYLYKRNKRAEPKLKLKYYFPLILIGIFLATVLNMIIFKYINVKDITTLSLILSIIASGIVGPILEEILFRYILLNRLLTFNSKTLSIIISAIVFALFHNGIINIIYAFILGLILSIIYLKYKNIKTSIIIHISANMIVSFLTQFNSYILIISIIGLITSILLLKRDWRNLSYE